MSHQQQQESERKKHQDSEGVGDDDRRALLRWVELVLEEEMKGQRHCRCAKHVASLSSKINSCI